jgi:hypothetical protein
MAILLFNIGDVQGPAKRNGEAAYYKRVERNPPIEAPRCLIENKARSAIDAAAIRMDRVADLKARISAGTYSVSAEDLAHSLLRSMRRS